jgi:Tol biopolymer transport system component
VWHASNARGVHIAPSGDSVSSIIEQPDGKSHSMVLAADGSGGRKVLNIGEEIGEWSPDARFSLYTVPAGGATDLGLLDHRDGTTRRLTNTPQDEAGGEFTSDGKFVVFRRSTMMKRISRVDVTRVLGGAK